MHTTLLRAERLGFKRRTLLQSTAAWSLLGLAGCTSNGGRLSGMPSKARVVVIGGGYGGATAAKYVRLLSNHQIEVVLIEPQPAFISCPLSNLVLSGARQIGDLGQPPAIDFLLNFDRERHRAPSDQGFAVVDDISRSRP